MNNCQELATPLKTTLKMDILKLGRIRHSKTPMDVPFQFRRKNGHSVSEGHIPVGFVATLSLQSGHSITLSVSENSEKFATGLHATHNENWNMGITDHYHKASTAHPLYVINMKGPRRSPSGNILDSQDLWNKYVISISGSDLDNLWQTFLLKLASYFHESIKMNSDIHLDISNGVSSFEQSSDVSHNSTPSWIHGGINSMKRLYRRIATINLDNSLPHSLQLSDCIDDSIVYTPLRATQTEHENRHEEVQVGDILGSLNRDPFTLFGIDCPITQRILFRLQQCQHRVLVCDIILPSKFHENVETDFGVSKEEGILSPAVISRESYIAYLGIGVFNPETESNDLTVDDESRLLWIADGLMRSDIPVPWNSYLGIGGIVCFHNSKEEITTWKHPHLSYFTHLVDICRQASEEKIMSMRVNMMMWEISYQNAGSHSADPPNLILSPNHVKELSLIVGLGSVLNNRVRGLKEALGELHAIYRETERVGKGDVARLKKKLEAEDTRFNEELDHQDVVRQHTHTSSFAPQKKYQTAKKVEMSDTGKCMRAQKMDSPCYGIVKNHIPGIPEEEIDSLVAGKIFCNHCTRRYGTGNSPSLQYRTKKLTKNDLFLSDTLPPRCSAPDLRELRDTVDTECTRDDPRNECSRVQNILCTSFCFHCIDFFCPGCFAEIHKSGNRTAHIVFATRLCQLCESFPARLSCQRQSGLNMETPEQWELCHRCFASQDFNLPPAEQYKEPFRINYRDIFKEKESSFVVQKKTNMVTDTKNNNRTNEHHTRGNVFNNPLEKIENLSNEDDIGENVFDTTFVPADYHKFYDTHGTPYYYNFFTNQSRRRIGLSK